MKAKIHIWPRHYSEKPTFFISFTNLPGYYVSHFIEHLHIPIDVLTTNTTLYHGRFQVTSSQDESYICFNTRQDAQSFIDIFLTPYLIMATLNS